MKTSELIAICQKDFANNVTYNRINGGIQAKFKDETLFNVAQVLSVRYKDFYFEPETLQAIVDYINTPVEEREEKQKYFVLAPKSWDKNKEDNHEAFVMAKSSNCIRPYFATKGEILDDDDFKFTLDEIDEYDLEDYARIKVEDYDQLY